MDFSNTFHFVHIPVMQLQYLNLSQICFVTAVNLFRMLTSPEIGVCT
jgi:hypothetical protein